MCCKWCTLPTLWLLVAVVSCLHLAAADRDSDSDRDRDSDYYTAAVVEFRPAIAGASSAQLLAENLAAYLELIQSANGTTDIIVFPEATLNSLLQLTAVPKPSNLSLCHTQTQRQTDTEEEEGDVAEFMRQLACAAVEAQTYLLFNVKERENCKKQQNDNDNNFDNDKNIDKNIDNDNNINTDNNNNIDNDNNINIDNNNNIDYNNNIDNDKNLENDKTIENNIYIDNNNNIYNDNNNNIETDNNNNIDNDCPARGYRLYNTNVVLDRRGAIVSRYRKWNLYLEPLLNRTAEPEIAIFETDFNVTFGHFVCFDMLFYTPAQELVERYNIRNIIVTKMFNSELPFLTASQLQQGWAWGNQVNLLAAGASLPQGGITGSGIYAGQRGALVRRMVGDSATSGVRQLLVARVARRPELEADEVTPDVERSTDAAQRQLVMLQQPQLRDFETWQVPLVNGSLQRRRLCHTDLCCDFELSLQLPEAALEYEYRLGVFVGQRRYEEAQQSVVRLCGVFACRNGSIESCGQLSGMAKVTSGGEQGNEQIQALTLQFNTLRVSGEFVTRPRRLLMPSTLSESLYALQATELDWSVLQAADVAENATADSAPTHVQLQLKKPQQQLLTFAIYGNYFDDDQRGGGATAAATASIGVVIGCLLLMRLQL
ncbi:hypothetical protein ACLKA6_003144 [Drosophila palustris]